ncbi:MAG: GatB/YqeY domain-containing protein [Gemmatimonadales bacterium]
MNGESARAAPSRDERSQKTTRSGAHPPSLHDPLRRQKPRTRAAPPPRPASDDETAEVLRRGIKRRRESVEVYEKAGRTELAATEAAEIKILEAYLPASVPPEEIRAAVREAIAAGATDMGKVMGAVMPRFKGRADGKVVNTIVREELAG